MPGIVGLISPKPAAECELLLEAMVASMMHEPFYDSGTYSAPEMGVYGGWVAHEHSRASMQPFLSDDGTVVVLQSGEITDDQRTDFAAVPELYHVEGEQCFARLNGLFSGLLIDHQQHEAFVFNDRYGSERIYYHLNGDEFYFATEAKALLRVLPQLRAFDSTGLAQYFAFGCTTDWCTLFRDIRLLPGGSFFRCSAGVVTQSRYFDETIWESQPLLSVESFDEHFREIFGKVSRRYFSSIEPEKLGISLTGGLDTRMIVACLPEEISKPKAYTFTGAESTTLDDRIAARVADELGIQHYLIRLKDDFFTNFASQADRSVYFTEGALGITGAHEVYFNHHARQLAPIRVTGLVGSEIFRGISTFKPQGLSPQLFAPEFRERVAQAAAERSAAETNAVSAAAFKNVPWNLFGAFAASRSQVTLRIPFLDNELVALAYRVPPTLRNSPEPALKLVQANAPRLARIPTDRRIEDGGSSLWRRLRRGLYEASFKTDYYYAYAMPRKLLFLDPLLNKFNSHLRVFGHHKFLRYRSWFRNELATYMRDMLRRDDVSGGGIWNETFVRQIADAHIKGRANYAYEINAVLTIDAVDRLLFKGLARPRINSSSRRVVRLEEASSKPICGN